MFGTFSTESIFHFIPKVKVIGVTIKGTVNDINFKIFKYRVSEWLLLNANSAISLQEQVNFPWYADGVRFVLDQHA
jgi:hypothetical protein